MGWPEVGCGLSWSADAGAEVQAGLWAPLQAAFLPRCMSCTLLDLSLLREWPDAVACWLLLLALQALNNPRLGRLLLIGVQLLAALPHWTTVGSLQWACWQTPCYELLAYRGPVVQLWSIACHLSLNRSLRIEHVVDTVPCPCQGWCCQHFGCGAPYKCCSRTQPACSLTLEHSAL